MRRSVKRWPSAVSSRGIHLDAARTIIELSDVDLWPENVLSELVDKNLLVSTISTQTGEARLSMLLSVQQFVRQKLTSILPNLHALECRHAQFFSQLRKRRRALSTAERCDEEVFNLLAAAERMA